MLPSTRLAVGTAIIPYLSRQLRMLEEKREPGKPLAYPFARVWKDKQEIDKNPQADRKAGCG